MRACGTFNFNCVGLFWRWIHLPIHPADSQWDSQQQCTQTDLYCSTAACTAVSLALWLLALRLHLDPLAPVAPGPGPALRLHHGLHLCLQQS